MRNLIVMPAFNEEQALSATLASLARLAAGFDVLIVNDGSTDRTAAVAESLVGTTSIPLHVVHLPINSGIGVAVQTGYRFAAERGGYRYVIQFDADGQHDPDALVPLVERCEQQGLDLCIGSRFLNATTDGFQSTFARRIGIRFFVGLIGFLSGIPVTDPTSGLRCAGPRAWKRFAESYPEDYPEPESLFWCVRNRLRVGEIPVTMHERQGGISSIRHLGIAYYMLKVTMSIVFDRLRAPRARSGMTAESLMLLGGASAFTITLYWVRRRELREKYAVAWVALASLLLLVGIFPWLITWFADWAHLSYPAAVLLIALTLIYLFSFTVSVSLTHQYRRNIRLTQEYAILEERVRRLEKAIGKQDVTAPTEEKPCESP